MLAWGKALVSAMHPVACVSGLLRRVGKRAKPTSPTGRFYPSSAGDRKQAAREVMGLPFEVERFFSLLWVCHLGRLF